MNAYRVIVISICIVILQSIQIMYATGTTQRAWSPMNVLDNFAWKVNQEDRIQDTALNDISNMQWQYSSEYKMANTLDSIRIQIAPYIQRIIYIGLSIAVLLIIYNWFLMVTDPLHWEGEGEKVKKRIVNISIGVGLLTGFYVVIQFILAALAYILK